MLWPVSLAVGAYLPASRKLRLLELEGNGESEFRLQHGSSGQVEVEPHTVESVRGNRVGVWLAFTSASEYFSAEAFSQFGVETVHVFTSNGTIPSRSDKPDHAGPHLAELARAITKKLIDIKEENKGREFVVVAMMPKTVALAIGWHLTQYEGRFFRDTHLMHYDQGKRTYIPMRVRPSQPRIPPRGNEELHDPFHPE